MRCSLRLSSIVPAVKLVSFDAIHTLIKPRLPIHTQYAETFAPFLGELSPERIKRSFKTALKQAQAEKPAYKGGSNDAWWTDVIRRTALGAGADSKALDVSLHKIVARLIRRFNSKEAYQLFDDVPPALRILHDRNLRMAIVSNTDSSMRNALQDLEILTYFRVVVLSGEEGVEKPHPSIFLKMLDTVNAKRGDAESIVEPHECLHVGDGLINDYQGARDAGMQSVLLRRCDYDYDDDQNAISEAKPFTLSGLHELTRMLAQAPPS